MVWERAVGIITVYASLYSAVLIGVLLASFLLVLLQSLLLMLDEAVVLPCFVGY
jgi:MFS superfamily sulfate permease-like transporter